MKTQVGLSLLLPHPNPTREAGARDGRCERPQAQGSGWRRRGSRRHHRRRTGGSHGAGLRGGCFHGRRAPSGAARRGRRRAGGGAVPNPNPSPSLSLGGCSDPVPVELSMGGDYYRACCGDSNPDPKLPCVGKKVLRSGHLLFLAKGIGWTSWKTCWFILTRAYQVCFRSDPNVPPPRGAEPIVTLGGIDLNSSGREWLSVVVKEEKETFDSVLS